MLPLSAGGGIASQFRQSIFGGRIGFMMKQNEPRQRADGRRQLLVYLKPELIRALKQKALDEDTHLYLVLERLVEASELKLRAKD